MSCHEFCYSENSNVVYLLLFLLVIEYDWKTLNLVSETSAIFWMRANYHIYSTR